ncbi:MAG TPA: type VI secretion system baseplate subunit TssE [Nannocystaceae bacterium]|nr:type VI secretion system baseplate subunit TssE [Nannocystaceae bacterium]
MPDVLDRIDLGRAGATADDHAAIVRHVGRLLNTTLGSAAAAPDLGLPSMSDLLHEFPDAKAIIQRAIREVIHRYEPRLRSVSIQPMTSDSPLEISFTISARLAHRPSVAPFVFQTHVARSHVRVE